MIREGVKCCFRDDRRFNALIHNFLGLGGDGSNGGNECVDFEIRADRDKSGAPDFRFGIAAGCGFR